MPEPDQHSPPHQTLADACQEALAYRFADPALLGQALGILRPPLTPGQAAVRQRLEFLGDAAWNFAVAETAFRLWPDASAGDLTRLRATWSSRSGLARLARQLGLPLPEAPGAGEPTAAELPPATGRSLDAASVPEGPSERVVAELFEAILGAVVMDGGLDPVRDLARRIIGRRGGPVTPPPMDPKSALQILAQSRFGALPVYRLLERRGPPHQPIFRLEVTVRGDGGNVSAQAEGSSRQAAERDAARRALELLSG
jgi:ribonuclease-3